MRTTSHAGLLPVGEAAQEDLVLTGRQFDRPALLRGDDVEDRTLETTTDLRHDEEVGLGLSGRCRR